MTEQSGTWQQSELLMRVLYPCHSPEPHLSKQGISWQERGEAGESCGSATSCGSCASERIPSPACVLGKEPTTPRQGQKEQGFSQASGMSSEPAASASEQSPSSLHSSSSLHLPESRRTRDRSPSPMRGYLIPSPLPTRRTRTYSATVRASEGPIYKGVCKCFCRSKGHGFISPADGGPDIFVHISDIEGEYVPVSGDEVTYKVCTIPPKNEKLQAVEVVITHLAPGTKHETWSGHVISS
ncbi:calcium-regulated heat-stable protein 1 isoform X1 [Tympanuchus pallidicinctus]|uniref:calcium-regulated heat-stable protein 1 isoform X1 n=2 Tax=Tetraoninae TaxID=466585 RepID=UPI002286DD9B|nr:calcium-regulated heat-stable protein 1 isoform X1 [Tympanuchus pallidicinctus]XP_052536139.1 calcium-regulated heat-stable protein 1 isoform X1 [Tympanuchus pallidicinctus]